MRPVEAAQNHEIHITYVNKKGKILPIPMLLALHWRLLQEREFSATCFYLPLTN